MKQTLSSIFSLTIVAATGLMISGGAAYAKPQPYFVEPMICKGQVNSRPPGWAKSYDKAGVKITSFKSMRKDCTLANSSATLSDYFEINQEIVVDSTPEISGWYGSPLMKDGSKVTIPNGAWPNEVELKITDTKMSDGVRTDTLVGRELIFKKGGKEYHYDFVCEAKVVDQASIIVNNTENCTNP